VTRIVEIWRRWIEVLADVLFAWGELWRARHRFLVAREHDAFVVCNAGARPAALLGRDPDPDAPQRSGPDSVLAVLSAANHASPELTRAARSGLVVLELPSDDIVTRRINVPVQAREFLPGIVRNQVDRLSPWAADQAVYGFDAEVSGDDPAALDVRIFICARSAVEGAREELEQLGLAPDRIVVRLDGKEASSAVALWSRLADAPQYIIERRRRELGVGVVVLVVLGAALSLWTSFSAASIRSESEEVAARSRALQRELQGSRTPQALAALRPEQRAWVSKETSPSAVIVLEALSRALPDTAYLTELRIDNTKVRIIGLASDAASLIAPLERSGHFAEVHFSAPTTRGVDGALFRFNIEARVTPRLDISEN
jgi:general secretion pathway protein L